FDPEMAKAFFGAIHAPGTCVELRVLEADWNRGGFIVHAEQFAKTLAGWYDREDAFLSDLHRLHGVSAYITANPVSPDLLARSHNKLAKAKSTTSDANIPRLL